VPRPTPTTTTTLPGGTPTPEPGDSPLGRFLLDPGPTSAAWARHLLDLAHTALAAGWPWLLAAALAAAAMIVMSRRRRRRRLDTGARQVAILPPPEADPAGAAALWANLHGLLRPRWRALLVGQPHVTFELAWSAGGLTVGMWVPGVVPPGLVERAVEAAWPGARATPTRPAPPLPLAAPAEGGELRLVRPECFPLRTDHDTDPLRSVLGAAGAPAEGETAVVQVLARPAGARRLARLGRAARAVRTGRSPTRAGRLADLVTPGPAAGTSRYAQDPTLAVDVRAILAKAASPGWVAVVRYGVADRAAAPASGYSGATPQQHRQQGQDGDTRGGTLPQAPHARRGKGQPGDTRAQRRARARLRGRAHALASAFAPYADRNRLERRRLRRPAQRLAARRLGRGDLLSSLELAALAHLPTDPAVPGLARAGARTVAPPPGVRATGKVLGDAQTGARRPVALAVADARAHLHLLGATGSGKSTLLTNLVLGDVRAGRGAVVIDPKGDLVSDLLDRLPTAAAGRVVLLDPDEPDAPPALNVLDGGDPDLAVDQLVGIFRRIFEAWWGPRTDDILRSACLTLLRHPAGGATLAEVPRLLADARFRQPYVAGVRDPILRGFWAWYQALSEPGQAQVIGPVMNKLRAFLLRSFVRDVVGAATSSFDMTRVLDGGLLLARVPKGTLGEESSRLLGSFVVARVWQAATGRAHRPQHQRRDASLYVDECQNFLTLPRSFDELLAEARGYRLSLVLAHQDLAQLPRELRDAASANARNKVWFACSPEDARALERHVTPELCAHDLAHLGAWQAAARLLVDGAQLPAFTLATRPAPPPVPGRARLIRSAARQRYGRTEAQRRAAARARHRARGNPPGTSGGPHGGTLPGPPHLPTP
jgi:hypothetical protein